ncbi:hypothetical protein KBZ21_39470, partial [Streptomyces sp. A73]|nr:hypothetical protein [Streptomyces sp. A73]
LCRLDPAADGVPGNQITAARRKAARLGWYGPLAWDDNIDAPAAPLPPPKQTTKHLLRIW